VAQPEQHQPQHVKHQQPQQHTAYTFPSMRATFSDIIHEAMEPGNKDRVQSILQKFDDDTVKVQALVTQAHEVMATTHKDCMSVIRQLLDGIWAGSGDAPQNDKSIANVTARSPSCSWLTTYLSLFMFPPFTSTTHLLLLLFYPFTSIVS
jgi:hypothetical protein